MQIKVACSCGQHYEFEVEPQNGAMPCNVVCPACGVDGTQAANQYITQQTSDVAAAAVPPAPAPSGLRISRPATSPAQPEPLSAPAAAATPPPIQKRFTRALEPDREPPKVEANVPMGVLGGVIAGALIAIAWYFLAVAIGQPIGFLSTVTGLLVGVGVRLLAKEGTPMLGYAAAMCAALSILGGRFMIENHFNFNSGFARAFKSAIAEQATIAKKAVDAKSDAEAKAWLVKYGELEHEPTDQDIKDFRQTTVPMMQSMLDGMKKAGKDLGNIGSDQEMTFSEKFNAFKGTMSVSNWIFFFIGVAGAWRIGSGKD